MKTQVKNKRPNTSSIHDQLGCDTLSLRGGVYLAKWSYFYSGGLSEQVCSEKITQAFPEAYVIDAGDHWHSFVGGAKTGGPQDTYYWVTFKLES